LNRYATAIPSEFEQFAVPRVVSEKDLQRVTRMLNDIPPSNGPVDPVPDDMFQDIVLWLGDVADAFCDPRYLNQRAELREMVLRFSRRDARLEQFESSLSGCL
jgi:hypothetical protein